jgi:hypothetical protein
MPCLVCGKPVTPVVGRGRQPDYCGTSCRRRQEKRRAKWDKRAAACAEDGFFAINRDLDRTPEQRAFWQQQLDEARRELGPRP